MPTEFSPKSQALTEALNTRVLVLDGAMGTMLQQAGLRPSDFGGPALEGCNEVLSLTRPDVILGIHRAYLEAGADIIETNTFGGTAVVLGEYGLRELSNTAQLSAPSLSSWPLVSLFAMLPDDPSTKEPPRPLQEPDGFRIANLA